MFSMSSNYQKSDFKKSLRMPQRQKDLQHIWIWIREQEQQQLQSKEQDQIQE